MVDIAVWQQINEQAVFYKSFHPIKPLILDSFDLTAACDDVLSVYFDGWQPTQQQFSLYLNIWDDMTEYLTPVRWGNKGDNGNNGNNGNKGNKSNKGN